MMLHEFTDLTGFEPSAEEYAEIEEQYYAFEGDKKAFCHHFLQSGGIQKVYDKRLETIERLRSEQMEVEKNLMQTIKEKDAQIARLEADLEREQEWQPFEDEHNVRQTEYEKLEAAGARELTDEEAAEMISKEFGFDRSTIQIIHDVPTQEISRHRRVRTTGSLQRKALFDAWDWNYIRFNVKSNVTRSYEMHDGDLRFYNA
ncbi:MAG: hypothetical protein J6A79_06620 [Clostridia bacterium]|nr:hypothetical protein [Clostridia bacterium]